MATKKTESKTKEPKVIKKSIAKKIAVKTVVEKKTKKTALSENIEKPAEETQKKKSVSSLESSVVSVNKGLKLDVFNTAGEKDGTITLPQKIFGVKINKQIIA